MDFKKWETIVLEWVNCLMISSPVRSLKGLRNGLFFSNLIKLLSPEESGTTETCLTAILQFLRKQYPNFNFQYEDDIISEDLVEIDLLEISSLLLHYSCIYDRRDILTSPLCHKLSKMTQVCIRAFLENIKPEVTKEEFFEIIERCISKSIKPKSNIHTLPAVPLSYDSPLQDFLQTPPPPIRLVRLQEKDKEINKLQAEIDLERFEKVDLQDELRIQKERSQKLSKQMSDKSAEIVKLRHEISDLENKSLPHQNNESRELQQRLRSEINSLEQYIAQLQKEQDQLYDERDAIKDKLRKVEGQYMIWHDKAISSERNFDDLLEKHQQQEMELKSLQAHCTELSALLEEFQAVKRVSESSIEVDTSLLENVATLETTASCEELACAVVEVQLKDAQKENAELKSVLKDNQEKSNKLNEELTKVKTTLEDLQNDYEILKADNEDLCGKVSLLTELQTALQNTRQELEQSALTVCELSKCNESLTLETTKLHQELSDTKTKLAVVENSNNSLTKNLNDLQNDYVYLEASHKAKEENCYALEKQVNLVQAQYNELFDNYNKTNFNLVSLTENFHKLEDDMEQSLQKLEGFVFDGSSHLDLKDHNVAFTKIFSQLEQNRVQHTEEKKAFTDSIYDYEVLVAKLRSDTELLNERESVNLQERQTLCDNIKCAEEKISSLENTVSDYVQKITDLSRTISEMSATIKEFEQLKRVVEQNENLISDLEAVNRSLEIKLDKSYEELVQSRNHQENLKKSLDSLEHIKSDFELKIADSEKKLAEDRENEENLNKTIVELKALTCVFEGEIIKKTDELQKYKGSEKDLLQKLEELKYQLFEAHNKILRERSVAELLEKTNFDQEKQFQQTIDGLNVEIEGYQSKVNELEMDLQSSNINCIAAQKDMENILRTQNALQEEMEACKIGFNKRISILEITKAKLEQDLQVTLKECVNIQEQFGMKVEECNNLKLEKDKCLSQKIEFEKQLEEALQKLAVQEQQCEQQDDLLAESNQKLLIVKLEVAEKKQHLQALEEDLTERHLKLQKFEEHVSSLDNQNKELSQKIMEFQNECLLLQDLKVALEKKSEALESNTWKIVSELSSKNEQLDDLVKKYQHYQEKSEREIADLRNITAERSSELEKLKETRSTIVLENQKEIDALQNKIKQLNEVVHSVNEREVQYIDEIRSIKDELSDTIAKYTETLQAKQEIENESEAQIKNLTENLHEVIEKYNNLDKTYADTNVKLSNVQQQLDALEEEKIQLEINILEQKTKYEDECSKCSSDLNLKIDEIRQRESDLKIELTETFQKLETSQENNSNLNDNLKKMCGEFALLKEEKFLLCQKLNNFNIICKELKSAFDSLKLSHIKFVNENYQNLNELQVELVQEIKTLISENDNIKVIIRNLEDKSKEIKTELQLAGALHVEKLEQKEVTRQALEEELKSYKEHITAMVEEKKVLEEQLSLERAEYDERRKEFEKDAEENKVKIEEYQVNITTLKCANDILETSKEFLQDEMNETNNKLKQLEEVKLIETKKLSDHVEVKEGEIQDLTSKINVLEAQITENVKRNNELVLELCNVNESLESLTKQHRKIQEVLSEEQENCTKKLIQIEANNADKQNLIENLQIENQNLTREISLARSEVGTLKEKVKTYLLERQTLELEIRTANEKLLGQDSVIRRQESAISEANSKLLGKLEEILELEKAKRNLQEKMGELCTELEKVKRSRDEIMDTQAKVFKDTENNLIRAHESATEAKNDLLKRLELMQNEKCYEKQMRCDIEKLLEGEKVAKEILEIRILELTNEKSKYVQLFSSLKHNIQCLASVLNEKPIQMFNTGAELNLNDIESLNSSITALREDILKVMEQNRSCIQEIATLEQDKSEITLKIEEAINEKKLINEEKEQLLNDYHILSNEKIEREEDLKRFSDIQIAHEILSAKYEQLKEFNKNSENVDLKNRELEQKITNLEKKTSETYTTYQKFAGHSITYKIAIGKLITERNVVEGILNNLGQNLTSVQMKMLHISDDREHARVVEQMQAFEVIFEDAQKQFTRISKKIHDIILAIVQIPSNVYDIVAKGSATRMEDIFEQINFDEELEKVIDCRDRANDLFEQLAAFEGSVNIKITKPQRENILRASNNVNIETKIKDEELKKKNMLLKQRLTLAENAKNNLEKKIKQLRQENKTLSEKTECVDNDFAYKALLQQHIQAKEEYEKTLSECKLQYNKLHREHEYYKANHKFIPEQIKYQKEMKTEYDVKLEREIVKLREAYGNLMSDNSKLDLENATMRKLLEDRTSQLSELKLIKEAYEKLLEENNKLKMELDTLKYKRNRDREALFDVYKKDRGESQKIQEIRSEYEVKLEKMKDKMIQLYREEFNKEVHKHQMDQNEKVQLLRTIEQLKQNMKELKLDKNKVHQQSSLSRDYSTFGSGESFFISSGPSQTRSNTQQAIRVRESLPGTRTLEDINDKVSVVRRRMVDDRKCATLPKSSVGMSVIEEDAVLKRSSVNSVPPALSQNLEMEDEADDMFNNKYLADLKEGRFVMPSDRESNVNRLSELKWRNSMCPPHLKSSYPAETQFSSPGQFKEEELKAGPIDFDDSMSTRLIPGEKPRKKDIGTTSYKKPGPPTPSKNGGRVSLQGNEFHLRDITREPSESKTPKRTTPSRLKALFMGRNSSVRDNSESQPGTPRSRRLSIFRKPK